MGTDHFSPTKPSQGQGHKSALEAHLYFMFTSDGKSQVPFTKAAVPWEQNACRTTLSCLAMCCLRLGDREKCCLLAGCAVRQGAPQWLSNNTASEETACFSISKKLLGSSTPQRMWGIESSTVFQASAWRWKRKKHQMSKPPSPCSLHVQTAMGKEGPPCDITVGDGTMYYGPWRTEHIQKHLNFETDSTRRSPLTFKGHNTWKNKNKMRLWSANIHI